MAPRSSDSRAPITIRAGDRWVLLGASGTGKTTFALMLIAALWRFYRVPTNILNTKPDDKVSTFRPSGVTTGRGFPLVTITKNAAPQPLKVWGVQNWEPEDNPIDEYAIYMERIRQMARGKRGVPSIFYADELANLGGNSGDTYPPEMSRLLKQARSLKVTTILGNQGYAKMPRDVIGQATHLVVFALRLSYDRREVAKQLDIDELTIDHPFGFWHTRLDRIEPAVYYRDAQSFFGQR